MAFPLVLLDFRKWGLLFLSFLVVAFGQPAWNSTFSVVAGAIGYALFWQGALEFPRHRFWIGSIWFAAVQSVHLSWLTSTEYMGLGILAIYAFLFVSMGIQFGLLTLLVRPPFRWGQILGIAGFWVLMEWVRLFPCTGFTWNPTGLSLAANAYSIQWASLFGIYGLSFWVILTNLLGLEALCRGTRKSGALFALAALLPYGFGMAHQQLWERSLDGTKELSVALVQTALLPEQKEYIRSKAFVPPIIQWDRILSYLDALSKLDLIVLPEGAIPGGAAYSFYSLDTVQLVWEAHFGEGSSKDFPPLEYPFAASGKGETWQVSNAFWMQSLANRFGAEVIAGLDHGEKSVKYNAAFHFQPRKKEIDRYEKRILVPIGEYIPLKGWKFLSTFIAEQFNIGDSFEAGVKAHVFQGKVPIGISICMEETYSYLIREIRQAGAQLFVSISNDGWFPASKLALQHYDHGRIRACENGVCLLRACNTGVTAAIDCFGKAIEIFPVSDSQAGVLAVKMPVRSYATLYLFWGDWAILAVSFCSLLGLLVGYFQKKKLL